MLTVTATLAIFILLGISSLAVFWAKRLAIPHTILLVLIGAFLGAISFIPTFSFLAEFQLTPELLFYLLLPTLIFESAYHMDVRKLVADSSIILLLSVGSFLVSALLVATGLFYALPLLSIDVPFTVCLLFGSLISATDPVAVLALFKEYGAPRRLSLIFEGESLFNDASAVALFLIVLGFTIDGGDTVTSFISGVGTFLSMLSVGVLFGLLIGGVFCFLVGYARDNEIASITLTIVLAHITFILAELLSTTPIFADVTIPISPIISTTIAALFMGNYGRVKMSKHAVTAIEHIWEQFAFMANSLVFILIGLLFIEMPLLNPTIIIATTLAIIVVATARAISIYPITALYNANTHTERQLPRPWRHLLAWGSLRGALAVTMVLLIPDTLALPNWALTLTPKEFLLSLTIGCIAATLFIKALTIKRFIKHFDLDALTATEEIEYQEARALMHQHVTTLLKKHQKRGYIDDRIATSLLKEHDAAFRSACNLVSELSSEHRDDLAFCVLRLYAIGIETRQLERLLHNNEISETVFRRINGKLCLQREAIELGELSPDTTLSHDARDIFEHIASVLRRVIHPTTEEKRFAEKYMYYRAQAIISRKVLKELQQVHMNASPIFTEDAVQHVTELYNQFKTNSEEKLAQHSNTDLTAARSLGETLAEHSVHSIEHTILDDVLRKSLITPKLHIRLSEEISSDSE